MIMCGLSKCVLVVYVKVRVLSQHCLERLGKMKTSLGQDCQHRVSGLSANLPKTGLEICIHLSATCSAVMRLRLMILI
jgi:hypothetical protein